MSSKLPLSIVIFLLFNFIARGQSDTYAVSKALFSSGKYNEICPVYYKGGIVFCSDRNSAAVAKYLTSDDKGFFKIYFVEDPSTKDWSSARLFSRELTTRLNDGPVTFSGDGNTAYFARNIFTEGKASEISGTRNKLGVFYSQMGPEGWKEPRELRFNNEWYNITSPCISPDGTRLFFASDKPGGYGGSDLYFCPWENDYWGTPVNLGPGINTPGNEAYPFMCTDGEIYFSSDGHPGLGGKDIYFSRYADSVWLEPVHLDAPVNSPYDDLGIITDPVMKSGFFSSNRDGTYDIFTFTTNFPQLFYCSPQRGNQYCFRFNDDNGLEINPETMLYAWSFGDESITRGASVDHCFPGPGKYYIDEYVLDRMSGRKIFSKQSYTLEIVEIEQPYITGPDFAVIGEELSFNGLKSNEPGYEITDYFWDFGDGSRSGGSTVRHSFGHAGNYDIKLGLVLKNLSTGTLKRSSVLKTIKVFNDLRERESFLSYDRSRTMALPAATEYDHARVSNYVATALDKSISHFFEVQVAVSDKKLDAGGDMFHALASRYQVKEKYELSTNLYRYIVAEEVNFLRAGVILADLYSLGYNDAIITAMPVTDPAEQELFDLETVYGKCADDFFGRYDSRLSSGGFAFLDQVLQLLNRHPDARLLIESFTDRAGRPDINLMLSQQRAQTIASYLISKGIDNRRLVTRGYGDKRPLALDSSDQERRMNQRIDLMLVK